jgi:hypothetical protein
VSDLQDFAAPSGIPGVGAGSSNSLVHYSQQHSSTSGLLLDPSLPPDALAVTLAAKRAALMERESALQVSNMSAARCGSRTLVRALPGPHTHLHTQRNAHKARPVPCC